MDKLNTLANVFNGIMIIGIVTFIMATCLTSISQYKHEAVRQGIKQVTTPVVKQWYNPYK